MFFFAQGYLHPDSAGQVTACIGARFSIPHTLEFSVPEILIFEGINSNYTIGSMCGIYI